MSTISKKLAKLNFGEIEYVCNDNTILSYYYTPHMRYLVQGKFVATTFISIARWSIKHLNTR